MINTAPLTFEQEYPGKDFGFDDLVVYINEWHEKVVSKRKRRRTRKSKSKSNNDSNVDNKKKKKEKERSARQNIHANIVEISII